MSRDKFPPKVWKKLEAVRCSLEGRIVLFTSCTGEKRRNKRPCDFYSPEGCLYYTLDEQMRFWRKQRKKKS